VPRELLTAEEIAQSERCAQHLLAEVYAHRLAEIRRRRGMTQTEVAKQMRVTQRRVSAIEHGAEQATRTTLAAYISALGGRLRLIAEFEDESLALG
jgi:transcriptional regulator with XRE-family HTH domain